MGMKRKSSVWNHFTKKEGKKYECNYCKTVVSTAGGSTGNLSRHLRKKTHPPLPFGVDLNSKTSHGKSGSPLTLLTSSSAPPKKFAEIIVESNTSGAVLGSPTSSISEMEVGDDIITVSHAEFEPSTSTSAVSKFKYLSTESSADDFFKVTEHVDFQKSNLLDLQLLKMICKEYHPFNLVEVTEFKKFASLLCPGYRLPSRRTLCRSLLPKMYKELVVKLKEQMRKTTAVALTADSWIAVNKQNCIAITAHYIDENTMLCASLLGCVKLNEKVTAHNFAETLNKICKDWDVNEKITAVVTENAEYNVAGIEECQWRHISCYAHSINLVVTAGLKPVDYIIEKIKNVVQFYKKSPNALATLYSTRKQLELPELKLKLADTTRWNSIYDMLIRVVFNKTPIIVTWTVLQNEEFIVTADEWAVCDHVIKLLAIFEEVTKEISSEKAVSLSKTVILTRTLLDYVVCYRRSHILPYLVVEMCNILVMKINENLVEAGGNVDLKYQAAFLDPRFKKTAFKNDTNKYNEVYKALASHIQTTLNSEPRLSPAIPLSISSCSTPKLWSVFDNKVAVSTGSCDPRSTGVAELDKYLAEPILPRTSDPLVWWNQRKLVYPNLYKITLKRLCIPASSIPCECIFSKAGQILTGRRNRLNSSNLSHVMFLNSNL